VVPADAEAPAEPPATPGQRRERCRTQGELSVGLFEKEGALPLTGKRTLV